MRRRGKWNFDRGECAAFLGSIQGESRAVGVEVVQSKPRVCQSMAFSPGTGRSKSVVIDLETQSVAVAVRTHKYVKLTIIAPASVPYGILDERLQQKGWHMRLH
jgi:hypothetical protein